MYATTSDFLYGLKFHFIDKLKTGNIIIDMLISSLFMYALNLVRYYNYSEIFDFININSFRKKNVLQFFSTKVTSCWEHDNCKYPLSYLSIMYYLTNNKKLKIRKMKQYNTTENSCNSEIFSNSNFEESISQLHYFANDVEPIEIAKHIFAKIYSKDDDKEQDKKAFTVTNYFIDIYSYKYHIKYLRKFVDKEIYEPYVKMLKKNSFGKQYLFNFSGTEEDMVIFKEKELKLVKDFDSIFFEGKDKLLEQLKLFSNNKDWYIKKGIPYKLGILLHGFPGCGKTSIIKAILKQTKRHAIIINLNQIKDEEEFDKIFYQKRICNKHIPDEQKIYIFEEIDTFDVVHKRTPTQNDKKAETSPEKLNEAEIKKMTMPQSSFNLGSILSKFDGIDSSEGSIIIATTNHIDKIDPALIRPGRMDINIELKKANKKVTLEILSHFFEMSEHDIQESYDEYILDYMYSPAEMIQMCIKYKNNIDDCIRELHKKT